MKKEQLMILEGLLKSEISPILLENIPANIFKNAVILESDCDISSLNGHYEKTEFYPPEWYTELINQQENSKPLLIINNINKVPSIEQTKFIEILKYKKVSTFDLPKDCIIIVTCNDLLENKINEEVYSLMAHV